MSWAARCRRRSSGGLLPASISGGGWRPKGSAGSARSITTARRRCRAARDMADVLVGSHKGVECRFYFDPADGRMLALEMFPDENSDPCEIYFADYRPIDGRVLPGRIEVCFGDDPYAAFEIKEFKSEKKEEKKSEKKQGQERQWMGSRDCKLQIANCKLQIADRVKQCMQGILSVSSHHSDAVLAGNGTSHFAFCILHFPFCISPSF